MPITPSSTSGWRRHYGIPNVYGEQFRKVKLDGALAVRHGLLGQGGFELVTSLANRTSPVLRGKWVLMNILGIIPPEPPPPNVPALKGGESSASGRNNRRRHYAAADGGTPCECGVCGLSSDDGPNRAFSHWRISMLSGSIAPRSLGTRLTRLKRQLVDGTRFSGPEGLREALSRSTRLNLCG